MAWSVVGNTIANAPSGGGAFSTGALNLSAAHFIGGFVAWNSVGSDPTVSDNQGNSITSTASAITTNNDCRIKFFYAPSATFVGGASHIFNIGAAAACASVFGFQNSLGKRANPLDTNQSSASAGNVSSLAATSLSTAENEELCLGGLALSVSGLSTPSATGCTLLNSRSGTADSPSLFSVWKENPTPAAFAPTFSWGGTTFRAVSFTVAIKAGQLVVVTRDPATNRRIGSFAPKLY